MHFVRGISKLGGTLSAQPLFRCSEQRLGDQSQNGTQYNNWMMVRAAGHNHNIVHLKRKYPKDRFSIHRLTNLEFMCGLVIYPKKYNFNQNEKIVLLAQFNHIIKVMGKNLDTFDFYLARLTYEVTKAMEDPPDLICLGTFMSSLVSMGNFSQGEWVMLTDEILAQKLDEDYDELFGVIIALGRYKEQLKASDNYLEISQNMVVPHIPVIFRRNLDLLRQYVTQNIYNLKECRLLFQALYQSNINESFFWNHVRDWFNIYTKEQLSRKEMDEYFIMKESAVEKVLHDHGVIRPRPILQELSSIVYILSEFGNISWRFVEFAQDLILYAIDNGSRLFQLYQKIAADEEQQFSSLAAQQRPSLNEHIKTSNQGQRNNIKEMERKYKTIFVNPISLKNNFLINLLVVLSRSYKKYREPTQKHQEEEQKNFYDKGKEVYLDPRVKNWLLLQLVKEEMQYTITELLMVHRCEAFLQDSRINLVEFIADKLATLRQTNTKFTEIVEMLDILPKLQYHKLKEVLADFLTRNHPSEILQMTKHIEANDTWPFLAEYLVRLPKAVNFHHKYFSFEENCYFILKLLQNVHSITSVAFPEHVQCEYDSEMEQLKESIKIVAYGRGFKLTVNSYFHQVMEQIDVVQFFEGGSS